MKYVPILFNTEMVRAIFEGRKTQTRRLVKQPPILGDILRDEKGWYYEDGTRNGHALIPPCNPGDILWVRETWHKDAGRYMYRANYTDNEKFYRNGKEVQLRWSPSIHMPKEAARIFLRVKDVRVERLKAITPEDCEREGALIINNPLIREDKATYKAAANQMMRKIWNNTVKPGDLLRVGWEANPWVWVIEFERLDTKERKNERAQA